MGYHYVKGVQEPHKLGKVAAMVKHFVCLSVPLSRLMTNSPGPPNKIHSRSPM